MRKNKAAQVYGYVVCVVAVVTFLIAMGVLIGSIIDIGNPQYAGYGDDTNLASFENYKVDAMKEIKTDAAYIPGDEELRSMFDAAKAEKIARATHRVRRTMIVNILLVVASVVLFVLHWQWMVRIDRRMVPEPVAGNGAPQREAVGAR